MIDINQDNSILENPFFFTHFVPHWPSMTLPPIRSRKKDQVFLKETSVLKRDWPGILSEVEY